MAITCVNPSIYHILPVTSKTKISGSWKCNLSSNTYVNDPLSIRLSFPFAKVMRECGRLFFFTLKRLLYTIIMPECPLFTVKFAYCNDRNAALTKPVWTLYLSFAIHFSECTLVRVFVLNFIWCNHSLYNTHCISYHFSVCLILFRDETDSR